MAYRGYRLRLIKAFCLAIASASSGPSRAARKSSTMHGQRTLSTFSTPTVGTVLDKTIRIQYTNFGSEGTRQDESFVWFSVYNAIINRRGFDKTLFLRYNSCS